MKKLLFILALCFFSYISFAQEERELSDYEKYRLEQEKIEHPQEEEVFYIVEDMPKFKGEDAKEFRKWIAENVIYPENAIKNGITGKVIVSFVVNKDGNVTNGKIEKSIDPDLDAEAIRVVESSPKWTPGNQRGKAVNVQFTFPINFVLDVPEEQATVINNYYYDRDLRHSLYFGYHYRSYHYDPFYYDYGWYGYPYYSSYYYGGYYPYYSHYYRPYYYGSYYYPRNYNRGVRYASSGALGSKRHYYYQPTKTYRSGYVTNNQTYTKKNVPATTRTITRSNVATKKPYTPTYNKPVMSTRPSYNTTVRTQKRNVHTYNRSATQSRSTTYNKPSQQRSTYARPSSSQSRSYSAPAKSSSSYRSTQPRSSSSSYSRSSAPTRSSGSYSRSSSGSSRSSSSGTMRSSSSSGKRK